MGVFFHFFPFEKRKDDMYMNGFRMSFMVVLPGFFVKRPGNVSVAKRLLAVTTVVFKERHL